MALKWTTYTQLDIVKKELRLAWNLSFQIDKSVLKLVIEVDYLFIYTNATAEIIIW